MTHYEAIELDPKTASPAERKEALEKMITSIETFKAKDWDGWCYCGNACWSAKYCSEECADGLVDKLAEAIEEIEQFAEEGMI